MRSIALWSTISATLISASELKPAPDNLQVPAPWKVGKCVKEYCNFANPNIGDGLVLIGTPGNIDILNSFSAFTKPNSEPPPFEVREIPGKGIGLIANRTERKPKRPLNSKGIIFHCMCSVARMSNLINQDLSTRNTVN
ncbi:hypothetical protein QBC45DRAFT_176906 [Copromyces sp. CBS 386.78]|nr:hypothetical protein QBC45DRAFT_176906 [Copromyces sp. CBS 386.78]